MSEETRLSFYFSEYLAPINMLVLLKDSYTAIRTHCSRIALFICLLFYFNKMSAAALLWLQNPPNSLNRLNRVYLYPTKYRESH